MAGANSQKQQTIAEDQEEAKQKLSSDVHPNLPEYKGKKTWGSLPVQRIYTVVVYTISKQEHKYIYIYFR